MRFIYYPVFLKLINKPCLVVGGGQIALRKVESLLSYGAEVEVISLEFVPELKRLKSVSFQQTNYRPEFCQEKFLIIAATDDLNLNKKIYHDGHQYSALVNVVDRIELCDFIVPSIVKRGDLQIAISTGGKSPALPG